MTYSLGITAILPCYNHARFLRARIESVLNQTHAVNQLIFLDDASNDGSAALAGNLLQDTEIDVVTCVNFQNSCNIPSQWNRAVEIADNPLIWIAETDDSCSLNLLEVLYRQLLRAGACLSYAQSHLIDEYDQIIGTAESYTNSIWPGAFSQNFVLDGSAFARSYLSHKNVIPNASAVLFRRDSYLRAGCANPFFKNCADWDLWVRISNQGLVAFHAEPLNYFRCHSLSTRSQGLTPHVSAEYIACRVNALGFSASQCDDTRCLLSSFYKSLSASPICSSLVNPFRVVSYFAEVQAAYERLGPTTLAADVSWPWIAALSFVHSLRRLGFSFLKQLYSRFAALKRLLGIY